MHRTGILLTPSKDPIIVTVNNERDIKRILSCQGLDTAFMGRQNYQITIYLDKYRSTKHLPINEMMVRLYPRYPYGIRELSGPVFLLDEHNDLSLDDLYKI